MQRQILEGLGATERMALELTDMKFSGELKTCLSADVGRLREAWAKLMRKIKAGVEDAGEYQETMKEAVQLGAEHKEHAKAATSILAGVKGGGKRRKQGKLARHLAEGANTSP